jgi:hypothetical protein
MSGKPKKPHELFDDLLEKQREIKKNQGFVSLEEARALIQKRKGAAAIKKQRPEKAPDNQNP